MARIEMTREFPVDLKPAWDYLNDPHHWTDWFANMLGVEDPDAAWEEPGNRIRFTYRLLGRARAGECVIDEREAPVMISCTAEAVGLPDVHQTWRHVASPGPTVSTTAVFETAEPTGFLGRMADRILISRALRKDLGKTLDNLEDIFSRGVPG
jgi:hypothetical protein